MTLAQVVRRRPESVPPGPARLIVRWDWETGWANLAVAAPGIGRARFVGFHRFAGGGADAVVSELAAAGCVAARAPRLNDELMELEAIVAVREVAPDAPR